MDLQKLIGQTNPDILKEELELLRARSEKLTQLEKEHATRIELEKGFEKLLTGFVNNNFIEKLEKLRLDREKALKELDHQFEEKLQTLLKDNPGFAQFNHLIERLHKDFDGK